MSPAGGKPYPKPAPKTKPTPKPIFPKPGMKAPGKKGK